jgi:hypothetical protein
LRQYPFEPALLFFGLLTDLDLLDALTNVFVAGNIYGSSMRRAIGQRARGIAGKSVFRALDHMRFFARAHVKGAGTVSSAEKFYVSSRLRVPA